MHWDQNLFIIKISFFFFYVIAWVSIRLIEKIKYNVPKAVSKFPKLSLEYG